MQKWTLHISTKFAIFIEVQVFFLTPAEQLSLCYSQNLLAAHKSPSELPEHEPCVCWRAVMQVLMRAAREQPNGCHIQTTFTQTNDTNAIPVRLDSQLCQKFSKCSHTRTLMRRPCNEWIWYLPCKLPRVPHLTSMANGMNFFIKSDTKICESVCRVTCSNTGSPLVLALNATESLINWLRSTWAMSLSVVTPFNVLNGLWVMSQWHRWGKDEALTSLNMEAKVEPRNKS